MKIVALLPFKNEEKFLHTCVSSMIGVVDEIVAIDDFSTDDSVKILKGFEDRVAIQIHDGIADKKDMPVEKLRTKLLELGRAAGGTHFVCLDADEAFTANFQAQGRKIISKLQPGQKLVMQWLAMWKSLDHYRDDKSVWSNNYKDFVVMDDKSIAVDEGIIHKGRTPGPNNEDTNLRLNNKYGAVFHFQFSDWDGFNMKQAWYRCFERSIGRDVASINNTYRITFEDKVCIVSAVPENWKLPLENLPKLSYHDNVAKGSWHLDEIKKLFNKHGIDMFYGLDLWHIPELKQLKESSIDSE
jgi:glycosyltransferase involved in cell wall biosynthesis